MIRLGFDGPAGSLPDPAAWNLNPGTYYNGYDTLYTNRPENVCCDGQGNLTVTARQELWYDGGITRAFTSARIDTKGKLPIPPGSYVECSAILPDAPGCWPAIWTVGTAQAQVGWPNAGEIDIAEVIGKAPGILWRALHQNTAGGTTDRAWGWDRPQAKTLTDPKQPHLYGMHFDGNGVRWYLNRKVVQTVTRQQVEAIGAVWHYDQPQDLILNLAVGNLGGNPLAGTWPQTMTVGPIGIYPPGTDVGAL